MNALELVRALDALLTVAISAGINIAKLTALREASGGTLTIEQIQELAAEARQSIDRL